MSFEPMVIWRWVTLRRPPTSIRGDSRDLASPTRARASATLAAALARSRLLARASTTRPSSAGSAKAFHHWRSTLAGFLAGAGGRSSFGD
jgi:hypothetical protein